MEADDKSRCPAVLALVEDVVTRPGARLQHKQDLNGFTNLEKPGSSEWKCFPPTYLLSVIGGAGMLARVGYF